MFTTRPLDFQHIGKIAEAKETGELKNWKTGKQQHRAEDHNQKNVQKHTSH